MLQTNENMGKSFIAKEQLSLEQVRPWYMLLPIFWTNGRRDGNSGDSQRKKC